MVGCRSWAARRAESGLPRLSAWWCVSCAELTPTVKTINLSLASLAATDTPKTHPLRLGDQFKFPLIDFVTGL